MTGTPAPPPTDVDVEALAPVGAALARRIEPAELRLGNPVERERHLRSRRRLRVPMARAADFLRAPRRRAPTSADRASNARNQPTRLALWTIDLVPQLTRRRVNRRSTMHEATAHRGEEPRPSSDARITAAKSRSVRSWR